MSDRQIILRAITTVFSLALLLTTITACGSPAKKGSAPILLFAGTGTSSGDVAALGTILTANHFARA